MAGDSKNEELGDVVKTITKQIEGLDGLSGHAAILAASALALAKNAKYAKCNCCEDCASSNPVKALQELRMTLKDLYAALAKSGTRPRDRLDELADELAARRAAGRKPA